MEYLLSAEGLIALSTLTILEIVLGIDNLIFISIILGRLPERLQARARMLGLSLALVFRIVFLAAASWIANLVEPLITIPQMLTMDAAFDLSGRDLIMLGGGLFLLGKATTELYQKVEGNEHESDDSSSNAKNQFWWLITQIVLLDLVFSIDSVITAIGLTSSFLVMVIAVTTAMAVMMLSARKISSFISKHPSVKILALAFLLMVGLLLFVEGFHVHVPKGYVYFAMAFSVLVEALNLRFRSKKRKTAPVTLRSPDYKAEG